MSSVTYTNSGDAVNSLPTDDSVPSEQEIQIADVLFKKQMSAMDKLFKSAKDAIVVGVFFIILSLPQVDELISRFMPVNGSPIMLTLVKAVLMMILYFLYSRLFLVVRSD